MGSVERFKAKLTAMGFQQDPGINVVETLSLVAKMTTIRMILVIAIGMWGRWMSIIHSQIGTLVKKFSWLNLNVFFYFVFLKHLCKLTKTLYGFKQAQRAWNDKFLAYSFKMGLLQHKKW